MKILKKRPVRGLWDWVVTGNWDGGETGTGANG